MNYVVKYKILDTNGAINAPSEYFTNKKNAMDFIKGLKLKSIEQKTPITIQLFQEVDYNSVAFLND